jgi:hypothetical protein
MLPSLIHSARLLANLGLSSDRSTKRSTDQKRRLPANELASLKRRRLTNDMTTSVLETGQEILAQRGADYSPPAILHITNHITDPFGAGLRKRHSRSHFSKNILKPVPTSCWLPVEVTQDQHGVSSTKLKPYSLEQLVECDLFSQQTTAGRVEVYYKKQCLLKHHGCSEDSDTKECSAEENFSARIVFIPALITDVGKKVILNVSRQSTSTGSLLSTPILSFRSIIRDDSEIFDIVRFGTLRDLQEAFRAGTASITNCNRDGRSLLNVSIKPPTCEISNKRANPLILVKFALSATRPRIVRFLLEAGAEPNSVEMNNTGFLG